MIALTSDGPEVVTIYGQAGTTAVKILTGRAPKEIPVHRSEVHAAIHAEKAQQEPPAVSSTEA